MTAGARMDADERPRVPAVGGTRTVPAPDSIATDYLLLGLRLDQRIPGLVDGYFGPAELKARAEIEPLPSASRLRDEAIALRERVAGDVHDAGRRAWLTAQLTALETHAALLAGEDVPYLTLVERSLGFAPPRHDDAEFAAALTTIDALLPGDGSVAERLADWDASLEVPVERVSAVVDWLVERFRARAGVLFGLPDGEDLRVSLVRDQPWTGYCWYDGGLRSRVDLNTDLPTRLPELVHTMAHETYPGHHLEHAWKEADLVERQGRLEASILLINTPECPISEGLADLGVSFAAPLDERVDLLAELFTFSGSPLAADPAATRATAELAVALAGPRRTLAAIRGNAALLRHADGWSHEAVLDYLRDVGGYASEVAAKRLEFIEHPLWRTYVFVYAEGEALLRRWLEAVPAPDRVERFGRLLHEPLTPASILAGPD
ncbi:MAG TPA: hypothetical protein VD763_02755 [Candidatus Saccharimonadales bacterium]|nr:hypothetical protein [Candidatus Saccharimonadales bacterium]